jgi:dihydroorotate dehydrogenase
MKLYISPPFGNYLGLLPGTTSIYGSFTLYPRPGLLGQIYKTLHYSYQNNGWINKIGLRNKGIDHMIHKWKKSIFSSIHKNNIVSVAILEYNDIDKLLDKIPEDMNLEINISCPNTDHAMIKQDVNKFLNSERKHCSLKCSPLTTTEEVDKYYEMGFRIFHFSNTLPVKFGGLSGITLIPYTESLTEYTHDKYGDSVEIISGGGIRNMKQVLKYKEKGCTAVSISTLCFNPLMFLWFYGNFMYYNRDLS